MGRIGRVRKAGKSLYPLLPEVEIVAVGLTLKVNNILEWIHTISQLHIGGSNFKSQLFDIVLRF